MYKQIFLFLILFTLLAAEPQAIVFDFGGVMTGKPNKELVVQFLKESFRLSDLEFEKVNREKHKAIQQGITDVEFWLEYAKRMHIKLSDDWTLKFIHVMKEAIAANPFMFDLVKELRQEGYQAVLLSNIDERLGKLIREFGYYDAFDTCFLSYELGYEKPDVRIYLHVLARLELEPADLLFIDDRLDNIESARSLGIDSIHFISLEQLKLELSKRGL